jgi:hypothetical protein
MSIIKLPVDKIQEQKFVSAHSFAELGCSTEGCEDPCTHIALVEITLVDGKKLSITRTYCAMCILAVRGMGEA